MIKLIKFPFNKSFWNREHAASSVSENVIRTELQALFCILFYENYSMSRSNEHGTIEVFFVIIQFGLSYVSKHKKRFFFESSCVCLCDIV